MRVRGFNWFWAKDVNLWKPDVVDESQTGGWRFPDPSTASGAAALRANGLSLDGEIGRAACWGRVEISGVGESLKKKEERARDT